MLRYFVVLFLALFASIANANDFEDADAKWKQGQPWPAHWGYAKYPYKDGWNVIMLAFVNKVYAPKDVADTWLKGISYAHQEGASIELCMAKRGIFKFATYCQPAVVDPEVRGTLKEGDVIAFFYSSHRTGRFSKGPDSDARTTLRVFQKITPAGDDMCWVSQLAVAHVPRADACFEKIDKAAVERILTRDFGPRGGGVVATVAAPESTTTPQNVNTLDESSTKVLDPVENKQETSKE